MSDDFKRRVRDDGRATAKSCGKQQNEDYRDRVHTAPIPRKNQPFRLSVCCLLSQATGHPVNLPSQAFFEERALSFNNNSSPHKLGINTPLEKEVDGGLDRGPVGFLEGLARTGLVDAECHDLRDHVGLDLA